MDTTPSAQSPFAPQSTPEPQNTNASWANFSSDAVDKSEASPLPDKDSGWADFASAAPEAPADWASFDPAPTPACDNFPDQKWSGVQMDTGSDADEAEGKTRPTSGCRQEQDK